MVLQTQSRGDNTLYVHSKVSKQAILPKGLHQLGLHAMIPPRTVKSLSLISTEATHRMSCAACGGSPSTLGPRRVQASVQQRSPLCNCSNQANSFSGSSQKRRTVLTFPLTWTAHAFMAVMSFRTCCSWNGNVRTKCQTPPLW